MKSSTVLADVIAPQFIACLWYASDWFTVLFGRLLSSFAIAYPHWIATSLANYLLDFSGTTFTVGC